MAPALSQREPEARSAMRVRQETDWYRVFKRDDSIDVLARAVRSGTAQDGATEEITGCAESVSIRPGAKALHMFFQHLEDQTISNMFQYLGGWMRINIQYIDNI